MPQWAVGWILGFITSLPEMTAFFAVFAAARNEDGSAPDDDVDCQENSEGVLVDAIHRAANEGVDYIIFNPAGYTHTSIALRDAMLAVRIPFVEVHLSAISSRESFRQVSYFSDIALGVISGFQGESYMLALQANINRIEP